MLPSAERIREVAGADPLALPDEVLESTEPLVLRGLAAGWPMVRAGLESQVAATTYLRRFYKDATVVVMSGEPGIGGRFSYNDDLSGFNFKMYRTRLDGVLGELAIDVRGLHRHRHRAAGLSRRERLQLRCAGAGGEHLDRQPHTHCRASRSA
jgi:hypothetical protein